MKKKSLSLILLSILLLAAYVSIASAHKPNPTDPTHLVIDTPNEPETTDPAWANDPTSSEWIQNVYEPLVFFDRDYTQGPYETGKIDSFIPKLATSWSIMPLVPPEPSPEGLWWHWRYIFTIRTGVPWHSILSRPLMPEDVEYSFERAMVQDRSGGPSWTIYQPLLNVTQAADPITDPLFGLKVDHAVESDTTSVWFNLVKPDVSPNQFLRILCHTVASVVNKPWCIAHGDLNIDDVPHGWANWQEIWNRWHDPVISFIEGDMMGTGPYKFDYHAYGDAWSIVRFEAYWGGWPARVSDDPNSPLYNQRLTSYVNRTTWNYIPSWITRKARFLANVSDQPYGVPKDKATIDELLSSPGIRCFYPLDLLIVDVLLYNLNISIQSPYLGLGFDPNNPYIIAEDRIRIDFFSDPDVRKAFTYSFDYDGYITLAYQNHAVQTACPVPKLLYYDPSDPKYKYDLTQAIAHFQVAWGGQVWQLGFSFTIPYPTGNVPKRYIAEQLANTINSLNPKFHISTIAVPWGSVYLPQIIAGMLPLWNIELLADNTNADAYYFFYNFMHSQGTFAHWQHYNNPAMDAAVEAHDYDQAQDIYYTDAPSVPLAQPLERHWEHDWMRGWYYNPLYPGEYVYHRWKAVTHFGDVNNDGKVDIFDAAYISAHWYPGPPIGPLGYSPNADINGGTGGIVCGGTGFVLGIPDGKVDIKDAALVSAYWDGPPQGPSHPPDP